MKIDRLPVGMLRENCYIVSDSGKGLIIDPGDDAQFIIDFLVRNELTPISIIATHGHFDHIMAAFEIQMYFKIPLLIHKNDEFLLSRMKRSAEYFTGANDIPPAPSIDDYLIDKEVVTFENLKFKIIEVPGHTPGSICLYEKKKSILFSGDLIFKRGIGRNDFSYSDENDLVQSIKKIMKLPDNTKIYPGHGEITSLGKERKYLNESIIHNT